MDGLPMENYEFTQKFNGNRWKQIIWLKTDDLSCALAEWIILAIIFPEIYFDSRYQFCDLCLFSFVLPNTTSACLHWCRLSCIIVPLHHILFFKMPILPPDRYRPFSLCQVKTISIPAHKYFLLSKLNIRIGYFVCFIAPVLLPSFRRLSGSPFDWSILFDALHVIQSMAFFVPSGPFTLIGWPSARYAGLLFAH